MKIQGNNPQPEQQEQEVKKLAQEQQEQEEKHRNHTTSSPPSNMHSSPSPPHSPPLSPLSPLSSNHHTSHNYLFSPPEVKPITVKPPSPSPAPLAATVEVNKAGSKAQDREAVRQVEEGDVGGRERRLRPNLSILRRAKMENIKRRTLLGFRLFGFLFCLVCLSVMAADKNQGWALDSFYRYKEFRYCLAVNVLGFVYSGFQSYDLVYSLAAGKFVARNQLRCYLDFSLDQILTYLLLSASSSAAFRVEEWEYNWGKDKFPVMARASVILSFLAFVAFALSSLISGYTLFNPSSS